MKETEQPLEVTQSQELLNAEAQTFQLHGEGITIDNESVSIYEPEKIGIMSKFDTGETTTIVAEVAVGESKFAVVRFDGDEDSTTMIGGLSANEEGGLMLNGTWRTLEINLPLIVGRNPRAENGEDTIRIDTLNKNTDPAAQDVAVSTNHLYVGINEKGQLEIKDTSRHGSSVTGVEAKMSDSDVETAPKEATPEEILSQSEPDTGVGVFEEQMIGDKDPARVQAKLFAATDYFVDKYVSLSSGPNGFSEAIDKLNRVTYELREYDQRDPENNKKTQDLIIQAEQLVDYLVGQEVFVSNEFDKSLAEGEPLSDLSQSVGGALEKIAGTEETSQVDSQFSAVGQTVVGSIQDIVANGDMTKQSSPTLRAELNRLFISLKDKMSAKDFDPRDVEFILSFVGEIKRNVDSRKNHTEEMRNKTQELALNAGILFKIVQDVKV
jgi:hypothetical protein